MFYFNEEMGLPGRWRTLATILASAPHNYSNADLAKIFGGNLLRVYKEALPGLREFALLSPSQNAPLSRTTGSFEW